LGRAGAFKKLHDNPDLCRDRQVLGSHPCQFGWLQGIRNSQGAEQVLVAEVGFEPTTSGPEPHRGSQNNVSPTAHNSDAKGKIATRLVAGACNHPNLLVLPFSLGLIRTAA
jgi:hypothetical protein